MVICYIVKIVKISVLTQEHHDITRIILETENTSVCHICYKENKDNRIDELPETVHYDSDTSYVYMVAIQAHLPISA
jgi:hypothetical protein